MKEVIIGYNDYRGKFNRIFIRQMIYSRIFYYWYVLLKKTPNGTGVFYATCYTAVVVLFHITAIFALVKLSTNFDMADFVALPYTSMGKYRYLPYVTLILLICYSYFKLRFNRIVQKFSAYTDKEILCWKNHVFVILVTLIPLAIIIYIASHY